MNMRSVMVLTAVCGIAACTRSEQIVFAGAETVSAATATGAAPMFAVASSGATAVAWVAAPENKLDGRLYVAVGGGSPVELRDPLGPIEAHGEAPPKIVYGVDGALHALYVVAKVVPGRRFPLGALRFTRSGDGGVTWSAPVTVTDDSVFGAHNFHALHAAADGALYVTWLDGREGKSAPFVARSLDGGRTWAANRRIGPGGDEACPCCRTAIATAPGGTLYVAWRAVLPGNVRDVVLARSTDGGVTWTTPVRVAADDWVYDGCPHAGPSLQVDSAGGVHVAWWTGKPGAAGAYYARSDDGGATFGPAVALGVARTSRPAHVQLALAPAGTVIVAWDDGTRREPAVVVRVARGGAPFTPPQIVSAAGVTATFPVVGARGDSVVVAWSEGTPAHVRVRRGRLAGR